MPLGVQRDQQRRADAVRRDPVGLHGGDGPTRMESNRPAVKLVEIGWGSPGVVAVDLRQPGRRTD